MIQHEGTIQAIEGNTLKIRLAVTSGCSSCQAKGSCSLSQVEGEKVIEVPAGQGIYRKGERVMVQMGFQQGLKAVLMGYVMPFLLLMGTLLLAYGMSGDEIKSGLIALAVLVPYYLLLYLTRKLTSKQFDYHIEKQTPQRT